MNAAIAMARRSIGNGQVIALCICIVLACGSSIRSVDAQPPTTLVLFEHEDRVAPGNTVVTSGSPSGNYSTIEFGTIKVIANVLTDGISIANSTKLGKAAGLVGFEDDLSLSLAFSFVLNTTSYAGSLTIQGVLDSSGNGELVVTGGSGDFRWARGYVEVLTVSTDDQADVVFLNTVHLRYDD